MLSVLSVVSVLVGCSAGAWDWRLPRMSGAPIWRPGKLRRASRTPATAIFLNSCGGGWNNSPPSLLDVHSINTMMKGTNTYSTLLVRRAVSSSSFLRHIRPRFMVQILCCGGGVWSGVECTLYHAIAHVSVQSGVFCAAVHWWRIV